MNYFKVLFPHLERLLNIQIWVILYLVGNKVKTKQKTSKQKTKQNKNKQTNE